MNLTSTQINEYFKTFISAIQSLELEAAENLTFGFAVPSPYLALAGGLCKMNPQIRIGAQNIHWAEQGAFTGEMSIPMLQDIGGTFSIVGHSERRTLFFETNSDVAKKVRSLQASGLTSILCVGENKEEYESNLTQKIVLNQLERSLEGISSSKDILIAYEPIWAIGTGLSAEPDEANEICGIIADWLKNRFQSPEKIPVLYGGSANQENAPGFISTDAIDGFLVGGASLKPGIFAEMISKLKD